LFFASTSSIPADFQDGRRRNDAGNLNACQEHNSKGKRFMSIAKDTQIFFRFFFFEFLLPPGNIYFSQKI